MQVNFVKELPEGIVKFEGTLEGVELDYVVEVGLNWLLANGLMPVTQASKDTTVQ